MVAVVPGSQCGMQILYRSVHTDAHIHTHYTHTHTHTHTHTCGPKTSPLYASPALLTSTATRGCVLFIHSAKEVMELGLARSSW